MATRSLRLHVNGTNYAVTGISDGTSYKDILCTIAKSKTEDEACTGLLTLTEMRQNKINAKRIRSPRICRKTSLTDGGMIETGEEKTGPRKSVERLSRRRKESCSSKERSRISKKEKEASPRREERALDDSDIESFRRSRRRLKNQIKRKAREDSDATAYQHLQNVASSPRRQSSTEKKQLGDRRYRSNDDVQKISIYYIDEKIDKSLLDYDDIARKACKGDSLLAMRKKSSSRESAASVSELDRSADLGNKNEAAQNTEDKDSGIPSWESEECSSKDGNKKEESNSNYESKRENNHSKDVKSIKESCSTGGTMLEGRSSIEGCGGGESSTEGVDKKFETRLTEVFERCLIVEFQRNFDSDLASRLGSSCPSLFETGKEGSKRIPKVSSSNMILENNGNECGIAEELLPVVEVEDDFCGRKNDKLTAENSENRELYEGMVETSFKQRTLTETTSSYNGGEKTEGDEIPSDFEEIRIPQDSLVNNDLRKKETSVANAKKVDAKGKLQFTGKKGPKESDNKKENKELIGENIKASQNARSTQQVKLACDTEAVNRNDKDSFATSLQDSVNSDVSVMLRNRERHVSYENRGSFILIDFDETDLNLPLVESEGNNGSNTQKDIGSTGSESRERKEDEENSEQISDLQSMGQTYSSVESGKSGTCLNVAACKDEEREIAAKVLTELDTSSRTSKESDCGSTASSSEPGDLMIKRKTSAQSRESSCSSFESDNVPGIRNKRIVYVEKLSEKKTDSKQPDMDKLETKVSPKNTINTDRLSKSLEAFSSEMSSASSEIKNCKLTVSNMEIRKASKKSSRKNSRETTADDSGKQEKVEEQRGEIKNGLYQRQRSDFDEMSSASLEIENCKTAVSNIELRKASKKSSRKNSKETKAEDSRKQEKIEEQRGEIKNGLYQRQRSDFDEMSNASLEIENCKPAVINIELRKASKKSSRKNSKEAKAEDSRKQEKIEEQRGEIKNGLYQRQQSDFDEIEDFGKLFENSLKNGNGKGLFSWFKKKDKRATKLTDNILKDSLIIQEKITNENVMKVSGIVAQNNGNVIREKCSCGNYFDENNNRRESTDSQHVFEVDLENIDVQGVSMGSVCEREAAKENETIVEDSVKMGLGLDGQEIKGNGGQLKENVMECEMMKEHARAESITKENKGACRDAERLGRTPAGDTRNTIAEAFSMEGACEALCKQKSSGYKTSDEGIGVRKMTENCIIKDENCKQDQQVAGETMSSNTRVNATNDIVDSKTCELSAEKSVETDNVENKISDSMAVTETNDLDRKKLWTEYKEMCDKIIEIAEKLLYLDLILNQKKHELQEIRANELLYEDGALDHDEKLIVRDIKDFRKYLKTVTLFSMRQREQLQENKQELEKFDRILRKKQSTLESLENMVMFKRFHDTPRQLLRKYAKSTCEFALPQDQ
eukprot:Seg1289.7 transcript_id=Seg1289.7/GoldUCD/mRNA.D3Y31 product="hypothetical protein" protein_id=Seg1289.7/GoldUCD/D3Y31